MAQAGHFELAEVAVGGRQMLGFDSGLCIRRIAIARQQVVGAGAQLLDAAVAARVHHARAHKKRQSDVGKFAVAEQGSMVAGAALALAHKQTQSPLRLHRVTRRGLAIAAAQCTHKVVKRGGTRLQTAHKCAQSFGSIDQGGFVRDVGGRPAPNALVSAAQIGILLQQLANVRPTAGHLLRMGQRCDGLRPEAVKRTIPGPPAAMHRVPQRRCVAGERFAAHRSGEAVGKRQTRHMATRAGQTATLGQPRVKKQTLPEGHGLRMGRQSIARIKRSGGWPGAVALNAAQLGRREIQQCFFGGRRRPRRDHTQGQGQQTAAQPASQKTALHSNSSSWVKRWAAVPAPPSTSKLNRQTPGMWNINPSAR